MSYSTSGGDILLTTPRMKPQRLTRPEAEALLEAHRHEHRIAMSPYDKPLVEVAVGLHEELRKAMIEQAGYKPSTRFEAMRDWLNDEGQQ